MKFSTREDIAAPIDHVFARLTDFRAFEREARRRGVDLSRTDPLAEIGPGFTWSLRFPLRGKMRRLVFHIADIQAPTLLKLDGESTGFNVTSEAQLIALSPRRTRLMLSFEIRPRNLTARLMLQTVRLNKASYSRRFAARVQRHAAQIELDWAKHQRG